jgi:polysaccharide export outer membrane protein
MNKVKSMRKSVLLLCVVFFMGFSVFSFYPHCMVLYALQTDSYKVRISDVLRISVAGKAGINDLFPVSSDGSINFPLLGKVSVCGLTVREIEQKLTDLLGKDYLVDPKVYVSVEKYDSQKVIVWGEVKSPGEYVLSGRTTLLEIIAQAGGMTDKASRRVMLFQDVKDPVQKSDIAEAVRGAIGKKDPVI